MTEVPSEQGRGAVAPPRPGKSKRTSQQAVLAKERVGDGIRKQMSSLPQHRETPAVTAEGGGFLSWNSVTFTYRYFP